MSREIICGRGTKVNGKYARNKTRLSSNKHHCNAIIIETNVCLINKLTYNTVEPA